MTNLSEESPVPSGWVARSDRAPTAKDANEYGDVFWTRRNGLGVWCPTVASWDAMMDYWMPIPPISKQRTEAEEALSKALSEHVSRFPVIEGNWQTQFTAGFRAGFIEGRRSLSMQLYPILGQNP